jgi:hypothetical protein
MFTVKKLDGNDWSLESASLVTYDSVTNVITAHGVVGGGNKTYSSGNIYVMNDFGKTVAVYDLDKKHATATK